MIYTNICDMREVYSISTRYEYHEECIQECIQEGDDEAFMHWLISKLCIISDDFNYESFVYNTGGDWEEITFEIYLEGALWLFERYLKSLDKYADRCPFIYLDMKKRSRELKRRKNKLLKEHQVTA